MNCGRPTRHPRDVTSSASCRAGERMRACRAASAASRCACASFSTAARRRMSASSRLLGSKLSPACRQCGAGVPVLIRAGPRETGMQPLLHSEQEDPHVQAAAATQSKPQPGMKDALNKQRSRHSSACCTHLAQLHAAVVLAQAQRALCCTVVRLLSRRVRAAPVNCRALRRQLVLPTQSTAVGRQDHSCTAASVPALLHATAPAAPHPSLSCTQAP